MKINSLHKGASLYQASSNANPQGKQDDKGIGSTNSRQDDRIEISDEAKKLGAIKQRVESGFYDNPEILRSVAEKINSEIG